jgi:hypothetical protein
VAEPLRISTPPTTSQLRGLARAALEQQGVAVERLRWMGEHSNHLFRCDTPTGLLAGRRLFLATFLLAHGLPAAAHLDLLRAFTARPECVLNPSAPSH